MSWQAQAVDPALNGLRLTPTSGEPVPVSDAAAADTVYLTPFRSNLLALYDGLRWVRYSTAELSYAVAGRTTDLPFDLFLYDNAGTLTFDPVDWTDGTNRATALARQDGVWCKSGALSRRYLGTIRPRSATSYDVVRSATYNSRQAAVDLWNADNRVRTGILLDATGASNHNYTTATIRQYDASANAQIDVVAGLEEAYFSGFALAMSSNTSANVGRQVGIGYDSTSAYDSEVLLDYAYLPANAYLWNSASIEKKVGIGRHYFAWLQYSVATGTTTWTPVVNGANTGMHATWEF